MENFSLPFEAPLVEIENKIEELKTFSKAQSIDLENEIEDLRKQYQKMGEKIFSDLSDWNRIQLARHPMRPTFNFYKNNAVDEFIELFGDRHFSNDPSIRCGLAKIGDRKFMLIGHFRGEDTEEKIACHFGCAFPEGYRKALQKMKLAEKFGIPVVTLVNTPGAFPGREAEERNQSEALAKNIMEMTHLRVPIVSIIMSEGGSGGALGIGVGDYLDMFENAYFSVISPEGCASILWKDEEKKEEAAQALKCTSPHLSELGIVDRVLPEPLCGAHRDPEAAAKTLRENLVDRLNELTSMPIDALLKRRNTRFRNIGVFCEKQLKSAKENKEEKES